MMRGRAGLRSDGQIHLQSWQSVRADHALAIGDVLMHSCTRLSSLVLLPRWLPQHCTKHVKSKRGPCDPFAVEMLAITLLVIGYTADK